MCFSDFIRPIKMTEPLKNQMDILKVNGKDDVKENNGRKVTGKGHY